MTRIVILGNTWHGNWSLSLFEELKKIREGVLHINVLPHHPKTGVFFFDNLVRRLFVWKINKKVMRKITKDDIVIVITPYTLTQKTFETLQQKNITCIAWLGDDPFRKGNASLYLPFFKKIFVVDESWIEPIQNLNPNVELLPHAFREDVFYPLEQNKKLYTVSFVGDSFNGNSEGYYRASLLKALYEADIEIALFGDSGWLRMAEKGQDYAFLKSIYHHPIQTLKDLNSLYNDSHIVLNIHHRQVKNGANQRIFEVSGAGAFQISDNQQLVRELFSTTIEQYSTPEELVSKIKYYREHPEEAKQKAREARAFANNHTYQKRIEKLLHSK